MDEILVMHEQLAGEVQKMRRSSMLEKARHAENALIIAETLIGELTVRILVLEKERQK